MGCGKHFEFFYEFETARSIRVKSKSIGLIYWTLFIAVFGYIIAYSMYMKKGYQASVPVRGLVDMKVKGIAWPGAIGGSPPTSNLTGVVYDQEDVASVVNNKLFITTAMLTTVQTRGTCASGAEHGNETYTCANGTAPAECASGTVKVKDGGVTTGHCLEDDSCEVYGWCPQEDDSQTVALAGILNMTVFIKMNTYFDFLGAQSAIHWDNLNGTKPTMGWNLFTVADLLEMGGLVPTEALLKDGVELELDIPFDCDFDLAPETCQPNAFVIKRIDSVNASLSHGADTREVIMSFEAPNSRKVVKHYGVKLEVTLSGVGRKFNIVTALTTFGAGVALLSVATLFADMMLMHGAECMFDPDTLGNIKILRGLKKENAQAAIAQSKSEKGPSSSLLAEDGEDKKDYGGSGTS